MAIANTPKPLLAALAALALAASACGGSDEAGDTVVSDTAVESGAGGSATVDGGSESSATGAPTSTDPFTFDASALTSTPLATGVLTLHGDSASGGVPVVPRPEAIIDSCGAIDAAAFSTIVSEADDFGSDYSFTSKADGATCFFEYETHLVGVTVQSPDVLDEAYIESLNFYEGDITTRDAGGTTFYYEDAFDIVTLLAVRAANSDFAVVVTNDGGTGLLAFEEEEIGWQRIAETALAGAATAGPPSDAAGAAGELAPTDVCSAFATADLNAAFDVEFVERAREATLCAWATSDDLVWVRVIAIREGTTADDYAELVEAGGGVFNNARGLETFGFEGSNSFTLSVEITIDRYGLSPLADGIPGQFDATPIAEAMAHNLMERLGS